MATVVNVMYSLNVVDSTMFLKYSNGVTWLMCDKIADTSFVLGLICCDNTVANRRIFRGISISAKY